ncbi:MAG: twin-arginine translocase TatA/TatE family subunit [Anaerolineae bacterium]|nr:twin-arginine translocase TatA/TatE family subunit [Anaerolineae bacterium]
MDNIFGIGLPELVLILVIAGMVMGPERIVRTARSLGALTARLQTISRTFIRQLNAELDNVDESGQIKSTVEELDQLRRQVADLKREVFTLAAGPAADIKQVTRGLQIEDENTIMPRGFDDPQSLTSPATPTEKSQSNIPHQLSMITEEETSSVTGNPITNEINGSSVPNLPKRIIVKEDPEP